MRRLYLVRPVSPTLPPRDKHTAKVISLRVRRELQRDARRASHPDRPDAA
jgi:hypothetical protein